MKKKILILILSLFAFLTSINTNIINTSKTLDFCDSDIASAENATIQEMIFDTMTDVDTYLNNLYSSKTNYTLTTSHNYGVLSKLNINQTRLGAKYNNLTNKHDLNGDGKINSDDNLNLADGICQPVAVTMSLRYMVLRDKYSYTPTINTNALDEINIFYDVVESYISNGWKGGGAARSLCYQSINDYFNTLNVKFSASYYTSDLMTYIDASYEKQIPAIGHISGDDGGHAVSICGYYVKTVTYTKQVLWWTETETKIYNFIVINDGWTTTDTTYPEGWYEDTYSFIDVSNLTGVTYIS